MRPSKLAALEAAGQLGLGFGVREVTPTPTTDWRPPDPTALPDRLEGLVGFDVETRDPDLRARGAGWAWRGGGEVVGISFAADNWSGYLPLGHGGGGNLDPDLVRRVAVAWLGDERQPKVAANSQYDVGWCRRWGVEVVGTVYDVQWAEALLDEHRRTYALDALALDYLGVGKNETVLREAAAAWGVDPKSGLWRLPSEFVGAYAETDSRVAREILIRQLARLADEDLGELFELETALLPMYVDMRWRGVRVDEERLDELDRAYGARVDAALDETRRIAGRSVDVWSARDVARAMDDAGLRGYGRTPRTDEPSITNEWLRRQSHPLAASMLTAREVDKLRGTFIRGVLKGNVHSGRVHGEFHPLRGDRGGTNTGRGSMSNPNLQFIPVRTGDGKLVRGCFLPEPGERWASVDYSQQEPRLLVHFASLTKRRGRPLPGALEARARYRDDPNMSYHEFTAELTGLPYKQAKILNLAIIYGRGIATTADELGVGRDEVRTMFDRHHRELPFARALSEVAQGRVDQKGFVRSLLGRRVRFPYWEPARWDDRAGRPMLPLDEARAVYPGVPLVRARRHKALNSLIQPSAADQMKKAMLDVWRAGLGGTVLIQVHDELCLSVSDEATAQRVAELLRDAVQLEVPTKVDVTLADRWGDVEE